MQTIVDSVKKTGRLLVIDECYGAVGAEIIAQVHESVDVPIVTKRLSTSFSPIPVNQEMENLVIVNPEKILESVNGILQR